MAGDKRNDWLSIEPHGSFLANPLQFLWPYSTRLSIWVTSWIFLILSTPFFFFFWEGSLVHREEEGEIRTKTQFVLAGICIAELLRSNFFYKGSDNKIFRGLDLCWNYAAVWWKQHWQEASERTAHECIPGKPHLWPPKSEFHFYTLQNSILSSP